MTQSNYYSKSRSSQRAFTLIELLVAMTVSVLVVAVIVMIARQSTLVVKNTTGRLSTQQEAALALDYIAADFAELVAPRRGQSTLALLPETLTGTADSTASSFWIMMLTRPKAQTERGALGAVSYRLLYTDPVVAAGPTPSFGLYRSVLTAAVTTQSLLNLNDLYSGYWQTNWVAYQSADSGKTLLGDFLISNVVDIKVALRYRNKAGVLTTTSAPSAQINWSYLGFVAGTAAGASPSGALATDAETQRPESLEITLTLLRPEGAMLYQSDRADKISLTTAIATYGVTVSRIIPLAPTAL